MSVTYGPAYSDKVDMLAEPAYGEPVEPGVVAVVSGIFTP
jgi:hypothetical protein